MKNSKGLNFVEATHSYYIGQKRVPSVTQVMNPVSKTLYQHVKREVLENKANIGTEVHRMIELYNEYGIEPVPMEQPTREDNYFHSYMEWEKTLEYNMVWKNEFKGYYSKDGVTFAGTIDNIRIKGEKITLPNGETKIKKVLALIDYKTVATPNEVMLSLQLYAYSLIVKERLGLEVDEMAGLCLREDGYEYVNVTAMVKDSKTAELFNTLYKLNDLLEYSGIKAAAEDYNDEKF